MKKKKKKLARPCTGMPINLQSPHDLKKKKGKRKNAREKTRIGVLAFLILRGPVPPSFMNGKKESRPRERRLRSKVVIARSFDDLKAIWRARARDFPSGIEGDHGFDNETISRN